MLRRWERSHPRPPMVARAGGAAYVAWQRERAKYENQAYEFFGMGPQGILEKGMDTPGIRDALALLQGPFAAIGAGARVLNKGLFGESKIGGVVPNYLDAPDKLKRQVDEYMSQLPALGLTATVAKDLLTQQLFREWVKTPEGRKWLAEETAKRRSESHESEQAFARDFYGENARNPDLLKGFNDRLEALNKFGNEPFQNEGANLLAQLLLDPLNAIPLNFTSYLARGKYAIEATAGARKAYARDRYQNVLTLTRELRAWGLAIWKEWRKG